MPGATMPGPSFAEVGRVPRETGRSTRIDNVVFDIGRVLVRLEFARFLQFLARHGVDTASVDRMLERIDLVRYERGAGKGSRGRGRSTL